MAGKERSIEIVDALGNTTILLDGDLIGIKSKNGGIIHDEDIINVLVVAASLDTYVWTPRTGVWVITGATSIISVSGGTGASVMPRVCSGITAVASGVAQLSAALDLEETGPNKQIGTMIAAPTEIFPGDSIGLDFSGTLTGLVGVVNVYVKRIS